MTDSTRIRHPKRTDPRIDVDLSDDGVLFMINVQIFHPLGFALCKWIDGGFALFGDGTERWVFSEDGPEGPDNDRKWQAFQDLLRRAASNGHSDRAAEDG